MLINDVIEWQKLLLKTEQFIALTNGFEKKKLIQAKFADFQYATIIFSIQEYAQVKTWLEIQAIISPNIKVMIILGEFNIDPNGLYLGINLQIRLSLSEQKLVLIAGAKSRLISLTPQQYYQHFYKIDEFQRNMLTKSYQNINLFDLRPYLSETQKLITKNQGIEIQKIQNLEERLKHSFTGIIFFTKACDKNSNTDRGCFIIRVFEYYENYQLNESQIQQASQILNSIKINVGYYSEQISVIKSTLQIGKHISIKNMIKQIDKKGDIIFQWQYSDKDIVVHELVSNINEIDHMKLTNYISQSEKNLDKISLNPLIIDRNKYKILVDIIQIFLIQIKLCCGLVSSTDDNLVLCNKCLKKHNIESIPTQIFSICQVFSGSQQLYLKLENQQAINFYSLTSARIEYLKKITIKSKGLFNITTLTTLKDSYGKDLLKVLFTMYEQKVVIGSFYVDSVKTKKTFNDIKRLKKSMPDSKNEMEIEDKDNWDGKCHINGTFDLVKDKLINVGSFYVTRVMSEKLDMKRHISMIVENIQYY